MCSTTQLQLLRSLPRLLLRRGFRGLLGSCARSTGRSNRRRRLASAFVDLCTLNKTHLLLLTLALEVLVGTKCERATDEDDSVEANTG